MTYKWIGAILTVAGCGGFGFALAMSQKREEKQLSQLLRVLQAMQCSLQYQLTPLPQLLRESAQETEGQLRMILGAMAEELEQQISPDAMSCMYAVLERNQDLGRSLRRLLRQLGRSLGRYDLSGQLQGLEAVRVACCVELENLRMNRDQRHRCYQTLGLCAGGALAILFL